MDTMWSSEVPQQVQDSVKDCGHSYSDRVGTKARKTVL